MQLFIHFVLKQPYGVSILPYELIYRDSVDCRDVTPMPLFVGSVPVFLYLSFQLRSASRLKRSECTSTGAFALSRVPVLLHLLVHANLSFSDSVLYFGGMDVDYSSGDCNGRERQRNRQRPTARGLR